MEELILVTGRTLVTAWAAAVFVDNNMEAEITLASRTSEDGGVRFVWTKTRGSVVHHNSRYDPVRSPGYVYTAWTDFFSVVLESKILPRLGINASSSGASEQCAPSSGLD